MAHPANDAKIVRTRDVQCNTEESSELNSEIDRGFDIEKYIDFQNLKNFWMAKAG